MDPARRHQETPRRYGKFSPSKPEWYSGGARTDVVRLDHENRRNSEKTVGRIAGIRPALIVLLQKPPLSVPGPQRLRTHGLVDHVRHVPLRGGGDFALLLRSTAADGCNAQTSHRVGPAPEPIPAWP